MEDEEEGIMEDKNIRTNIRNNMCVCVYVYTYTYAQAQNIHDTYLYMCADIPAFPNIYAHTQAKGDSLWITLSRSHGKQHRRLHKKTPPKATDAPEPMGARQERAKESE